MPESAESPHYDLERLVRRIVREELQALIDPSQRTAPKPDSAAGESRIATVVEFLERVDPDQKMSQREAAGVLLARFPEIFIR